MLRMAARALSLAAAVAMTTGATAALNVYGVWSLPPDRCGLGPPSAIHIDFNVEPGLTVPPPLPRFIHPRVAHLKPPTILCEVPRDPTAVTDCGEPIRAE